MLKPLVPLFLLLFSLSALGAAAEIRDLQGNPHRPTDVKRTAAVLVFILHDCPISNAYAPELERIAAACAERNVPFYLVYADLDVTLDALKQHARDYAYHCTTLHDPQRLLAKSLSATIAPQAFVLSKDGAIQYQGRIDDRYAAMGKPRATPTKRDLRDAIDAVLSNRPVAEPKTPAIGCSIE